MKPLSNTVDNSQPKIRLDLFDPKLGLDRGRSRLVEALWYIVKCIFFLSPLPWPMGLKRSLLSVFGAKLGTAVVIKPRVNIHFPWKLTVGDNSWIGEEVFILNFEPVQIGSHVCISQRSFLCGGNHDYRCPDFRYRNGPITVKDGAWIGASTFVAPNVEIGSNSVTTAGSIVTKSLPGNHICSGNPCIPIKLRWPDRAIDPE